MEARQLRIVGPFRCCPRRECAGRNARLSDRRDFTDRSAARGARRGLRAMPKDYTGFRGGNRRRRQFAARYGARPIRIQSGRRHRIDCRGARRNCVVRIERQYVATDDGRHERRRGAPFGSDQQDRPSSGWRQDYETHLTCYVCFWR